MPKLFLRHLNAMSDIQCEKCNGQLEQEVSGFYVCDTCGRNVARTS